MTEIHPRLNEVLQSNIGNKLTPELSAGIAATLQQIMNTVAQEAFTAGQAAAQQRIDAPGADEAADVQPMES